MSNFNNTTMKFVYFAFIAILLLICTQIIYDQQREQTKKIEAVQRQLNNIQVATGAILDAAAENLLVDSMHMRWQARYWTPRDAYLLEKSATVSAIKAHNLSIARQKLDSLSTLVFYTVDTLFVDNDKSTAVQVSFSKKQ